MNPNNQVAYYLRVAPTISLLAVIIGLIWFWLWNSKVDAVEIASSYDSVVSKGEIWRIFTSSFGHLGLLHVGMNLSTLLSLVSLESQWGHVRFFLWSLIRSLTCSMNMWLAVVTQVVLLFLTWLTDRLGVYHGRSVWGLGYSCVLFALVTLSVLEGDTKCAVNLYGICFPTWVIPLPIPC